MSAVQPQQYQVATDVLAKRAEEESRFALSQWQLMWRKFVRSRAATVGGSVVVLSYVMAIFAGFLAPYGGDQRFTTYLFAPPQGLHWDLEHGLYIHGLTAKRDPETLAMVFGTDTSRIIPVQFFVHDQPYKLFGFIETDVHLYGVADKDIGIFLLGSDRQGRDMVSRLVIGSQISLTIGLVGVFLSLLLGSVLGVVSGYFGGWVDNIMQRTIEVIRSFPTIPLWMALSAALPQHWTSEQQYFGITIILSFVGWTWLARQLRGKVLAVREEEFVLAAQLSGASDRWVIFRHLIPAVFGHIIVIATLVMPRMIIAESTLSFFGIGLRPPTISWGVLLQEAQNLHTIRQAPWLLSPVLFIAVAVLALNFFGDGLRDAADPYAR
ncbi:MAG: ABC transporter permease [Chloroflexi bacterium]|nr:ABC transporter permease [Chloroflexota bacterium]